MAKKIMLIILALSIGSIGLLGTSFSQAKPNEVLDAIINGNRIFSYGIGVRRPNGEVDKTPNMGISVSNDTVTIEVKTPLNNDDLLINFKIKSCCEIIFMAETEVGFDDYDEYVSAIFYGDNSTTIKGKLYQHGSYRASLIKYTNINIKNYKIYISGGIYYNSFQRKTMSFESDMIFQKSKNSNIKMNMHLAHHFNFNKYKNTSIGVDVEYKIE